MVTIDHRKEERKSRMTTALVVGPHILQHGSEMEMRTGIERAFGEVAADLISDNTPRFQCDTGLHYLVQGHTYFQTKVLLSPKRLFVEGELVFTPQ